MQIEQFSDILEWTANYHKALAEQPLDQRSHSIYTSRFYRCVYYSLVKLDSACIKRLITVNFNGVRFE